MVRTLSLKDVVRFLYREYRYKFAIQIPHDDGLAPIPYTKIPSPNTITGI